MKLSNPSSPSKIYSIENLRGIAALMVLICHIGMITPYLYIPAISFFQNGVTLFFVISGFIIPYSMYLSGYELKRFGTFILKRICRIEPPYLITVCLSYVIYHFISPQRLPPLFDMALHIGYLVPFFSGTVWINHVYWTLAIEFQFYILIAFLLPLILRSNKYLAILICFLLLAMLFIKIPSVNNGEMLYTYIINFSIGIFTFLFFIKRITKVEYFIGLILYLILGKLMISYTQAIVSVLSSLAILFLNRKSTFGSFFGGISYSLYITHSIVSTVLDYPLSFLFKGDHIILDGFYLIMTGVICIAFAYGFNVFVEVPFLKFSKRVRYNKT